MKFFLKKTILTILVPVLASTLGGCGIPIITGTAYDVPIPTSDVVYNVPSNSGATYNVPVSGGSQSSGSTYNVPAGSSSGTSYNVPVGGSNGGGTVYNVPAGGGTTYNVTN